MGQVASELTSPGGTTFIVSKNGSTKRFSKSSVKKPKEKATDSESKSDIEKLQEDLKQNEKSLEEEKKLFGGKRGRKKHVVQSSFVMDLIEQNLKLKQRENELLKRVINSETEKEKLKNFFSGEQKKIDAFEEEKNLLSVQIQSLEESREKMEKKEKVLLEKGKFLDLYSQKIISKEKEFNGKIMNLEKEKSELSKKINKIQTDRMMSLKLKGKRSDVLKAFFIKEKNYLTQLKNLKEYYIDPIKKKKILSKERIILIFGPINAILKKTYHFLRDLELNLFGSYNEEYVNELIVNYFHNFTEYFNFTADFESYFNALTEEIEKSKKFQKFYKEQSTKLKIKDEQICTIFGFLTVPLQRINHYTSLLNELRKNTQDEKQHFKFLEEVIIKFNSVIESCNKKLNDFKEGLKVIDVMEDLTSGIVINPIKSILLMQTKCYKMDGKKKTGVVKLYVLGKPNIVICWNNMNNFVKMDLNSKDLFKFLTNDKEKIAQVNIKRQKLKLKFDDKNSYEEFCDNLGAFKQ